MSEEKDIQKTADGSLPDAEKPAKKAKTGSRRSKTSSGTASESSARKRRATSGKKTGSKAEKKSTESALSTQNPNQNTEQAETSRPSEVNIDTIAAQKTSAEDMSPAVKNQELNDKPADTDRAEPVQAADPAEQESLKDIPLDAEIQVIEEPKSSDPEPELISQDDHQKDIPLDAEIKVIEEPKSTRAAKKQEPKPAAEKQEVAAEAFAEPQSSASDAEAKKSEADTEAATTGITAAAGETAAKAAEDTAGDAVSEEAAKESAAETEKEPDSLKPDAQPEIQPEAPAAESAAAVEHHAEVAADAGQDEPISAQAENPLDEKPQEEAHAENPVPSVAEVQSEPEVSAESADQLQKPTAEDAPAEKQEQASEALTEQKKDQSAADMDAPQMTVAAEQIAAAEPSGAAPEAVTAAVAETAAAEQPEAVKAADPDHMHADQTEQTQTENKHAEAQGITRITARLRYTAPDACMEYRLNHLYDSWSLPLWKVFFKWGIVLSVYIYVLAEKLNANAFSIVRMTFTDGVWLWMRLIILALFIEVGSSVMFSRMCRRWYQPVSKFTVFSVLSETAPVTALVYTIAGVLTSFNPVIGISALIAAMGFVSVLRIYGFELAGGIHKRQLALLVGIIAGMAAIIGCFWFWLTCQDLLKILAVIMNL